ncbi:hypothetical protein [Micromonospora carbonacea]|uniref:Uncharacterized protein n=1 Tax=Micromonospora carbonacea TaxID=47853 RepID=A0A1C4YEH8_9ACTN|nr:hypothetical protein [Micromonospora carbonacea]SCF19149.1 hypothetical protein GA0070563_10666 [Micromonospora carbonacea]
MRVITAPPRPSGEFLTIPVAESTPGESVVVTWCREIVTNIAVSAGATVDSAEYLLRLHPHGYAPHLLYCCFLIAGHTVAVSVLWDDLWREPGFGLAVDGQPVSLDATSAARPAAVIAYTAWQAILAGGRRR